MVGEEEEKVERERLEVMEGWKREWLLGEVCTGEDGAMDGRVNEVVREKNMMEENVEMEHSERYG